jgi:hypothetical protein
MMHLFPMGHAAPSPNAGGCGGINARSRWLVIKEKQNSFISLVLPLVVVVAELDMESLVHGHVLQLVATDHVDHEPSVAMAPWSIFVVLSTESQNLNLVLNF